ncbi:hypothetical protein FACS189472_12350 [Alphaproteobacteria bacterium]|nr:hypothetical protein FACS189472_12350 [Alphaproteobacteria bacterium]
MALLYICGKIDAYKKAQEVEKPENERLFISVRIDGFYLNDAKIVDKKAELQFAILKILIKLSAEELFTGESKYISISQISSILKSQNIFENDEKQIRSAIYYIRVSIKAAHKH